MTITTTLPPLAPPSPKARTKRAGQLNPVIAEAAKSGCLALGTLDNLVSAAGIKLRCATAPVILLTPHNPLRAPKTRPLPQFEGGEHTAIGDSVLLHFSDSVPAQPAWKVKLGLPNGLALTYGQIVSLGGDFYGIPSAPISDGATADERKTRFTNAYNTLAVAPAAATEAPKILAVMREEIAAVNQALAAGLPASAAYKKLGDTLSAKWNVITGGGSFISDWYPMGRYLQLSAKNWDHFGKWAALAYEAGHAVAIKQALDASRAPPAQRRKLLDWAYAMNAFADHFLTDLFSAGHIRTPRKQLHDAVSPSEAGALLSRYMHDEDCLWGLAVTNQNGNRWRTYGDKRYFDTVDVSNKAQVDIAVQESVNEVYLAFSRGEAPVGYAALRRVADLAVVSDRSRAQDLGNVSPLFAWNGSTVLKRDELNDLNDYSWTDDWWGWSTLALLKRTYAPAAPQGYQEAPATAPAIVAWSANQSVPPRWMAGAAVSYAVSFVGKLYESAAGPWSAGATVGANQAYPTLDAVPTGPAGTVARRLYRRFQGQPYAYVGQIPDNVTTTFTDRTP
jgi:hypothetical protein